MQMQMQMEEAHTDVNSDEDADADAGGSRGSGRGGCRDKRLPFGLAKVFHTNVNNASLNMSCFRT